MCSREPRSWKRRSSVIRIEAVHASVLSMHRKQCAKCTAYAASQIVFNEPESSNTSIESFTLHSM